MGKIFRLFSPVALIVWLTIPLQAQPTRIAVIGDSSLDNLVELTTAELSKSPDLALVERADLAKLGQEQALQAAIASNQLPPVQFVPADGLLILRGVKQPDGSLGIFARLVAVQPGVILREVPLPSTSDPVAQVQALVKEFAPCWPKIAAIQLKKVTPLSLLGLRFEVDSPDTRELERRVNVLLASRLGSEPATVVLERWRLNDAVFEKSLGTQAPPPFWTGSSLIDGSMKSVDNLITVTLRVRPSQGAETSISDSDKADQLPALVERLADKIQAHPITQGAWQPAAEADHFAALGKWCLDNRLYAEGAEAIESALALGDTSRTTRMLQIRAYALLAYPDDFQNVDGVYGVKLEAVTADTLPAYIASGVQAANLASVYLNDNRDFLGPEGSMEDPAPLSRAVLHNLLRTLRLAYDKDSHHANSGDVTILRHAVQKLIAQMEQMPANNPPAGTPYFLKYKIAYAAFWHESPETTLAYYRALLSDKKAGAANRQEMFVEGFPREHPPVLDDDHDSDERDAWQIGSPWVISWDESPDQMKTLWQNFLNELSHSPDPVSQADAIKFESSGTQLDAGRNALEVRFIALLQQNQAMFSDPRCNEFVAGFFPMMQWAAGKDSSHALRTMMAAQLQAHALLPAEWLTHFSLVFRYKEQSKEAANFRQLLDDYAQWYAAQSPQDPAIVNALSRARGSFVDPTAEATLKKSLGGFLPVRAYWPGAEIKEAVDSNSFMVFDGKIWFATMSRGPAHPAQVLCVDPASLETIHSYPIPDELGARKHGNAYPMTLDVSPDWLAVGVNQHVLVCSRATQKWRELDVPAAHYRPRWVNGELYLLYDYNPLSHDYTNGASTGATAISGLVHVSLPDGTTDNVISSRRVPPQTALDGRPLGYALDMWGAPNPTIAFDGGDPRFEVYSSPRGKNDWKSVFSGTLGCDVKVEAQGTLFANESDGRGLTQLVLMKGATAHLLLLNPKRGTGAGTDEPEWKFPEDLASAGAQELSQCSAALHGNDLYVYRNILNGTGDGQQASLYYFAEGQKTGVKIPLAFQAEQTDPNLIPIRSAIYDFRSVLATDYGLVIGQVMRGFWVIPWQDIEAYRTGATIVTAPTSPHPAAHPQEVQITDGPPVKRTAPSAPASVPAANPNERD